LSYIDTLPKGFYASLGTVTGLTICLLSLLYWAWHGKRFRPTAHRRTRRRHPGLWLFAVWDDWPARL